MNEYFCNFCNYKTTDKRNFYRHNNSKKHLEKLNSQSIEKIELAQISTKLAPNSSFNNKNEYQCPYCGLVLNHKSSLSRHKKTCSDKRVDDTLLNHKVELLEKEMEIDKIRIQQADERLEMADERLKQSEDHISFLRSMIISSTKGTGSSLTSNLYEHYADNPSINNIDYKKLSLYLKPKSKLINRILYSFEKNQIHKFLGEFILTIVKKKNYEDQSVFTSDSSRLNYMIKENIFENVSEWVLDKKGLKVLKYIINPAISQAIEMMEKYKLSLSPSGTINLSTDELLELNKRAQLVVKLLNELKDGSISGRVNRYISPYLVMDKKILNELEQKQIPTLDNN